MCWMFAGGPRFGSVTAEPITVDIVSPDEAAPPSKKEEPTPKAQPSDAFDLFSKSAPSSSPEPAAPQAVQPQKQAALSTPRPNPRQPQQATAPPHPPPTPPLPSSIPPQPHLSSNTPAHLSLPPHLPPHPP